eukprot:SAG11_NODE_35354_length_267_cov_0.595238_1_plen_33_part_10
MNSISLSLQSKIVEYTGLNEQVQGEIEFRGGIL